MYNYFRSQHASAPVTTKLDFAREID